MDGRARLARHLRGAGIELGPGHQPFDLPSDVTVTYVDRWLPEENLRLYPELGSEATFPVIDIIADFDVDRLRAIGDESQDFVICSHVLEHLADPIGFLSEIHRVLRPDCLTLVLLPDRRLTFDRDRPPTTLEHLVAEHTARTVVVDDDHVAEFLALSGPEAAFTQLPEGGDRDEFFDWHRLRSIHVHCWAEGEFDPVLDYCRAELHEAWEIVERLTVEPGTIEFGFVLRKGPRRRWRLGKARRA